jgi:protein tyrosine phosphatase (PTP) superfamily phosphohydrolase (DUF442 family)
MDFSQITDQLYIGTTPRRGDYEMLRGLGIQLVINMRFLRGRAPADGKPAMLYLRLRTADNPLLPIPTEVLMRGTRAALEVMRRGGNVYIHCSRGRHRSVAMAAAILIAQGRSPQEAMDLLKAQRAAADPDARHIRSQIVEFALRWSETKPSKAAVNRQP